MTEHRPLWPADKKPHERGLFQAYERFATRDAVWVAFREKYGYDPQHLVRTGGGWLAGPIGEGEGWNG